MVHPKTEGQAHHFLDFWKISRIFDFWDQDEPRRLSGPLSTTVKAGSEGKLLRFRGIGQRTLMDWFTRRMYHQHEIFIIFWITLAITGYVCPGSGFPVLLVFQHVQPIWGYHSSVPINWYIHTWWILVAWLVLRAQIYAHFEELESKQSWPVCNVAVKLLHWPFPKPIGITCPVPSTRWFKCTTSWIAAFFEVWHYGNTICF